MSKKAQAKESKVTKLDNAIAQPKKFIVGIEIQGTATLIQNNFCQKTIEEMLRKHMGIAVQKQTKIPRECIENAIIKNINGVVCIPPVAIKQAMISASSQIKGMMKTRLKTQIYVIGQSVPIKFSRMEPRMDMVKTSGMTRVPDVRFRPEFHDWSARILIEYSEMLKAETVIDLLARAGDIGVGEWRPEKNGTHGTFRVIRALTSSKEIDEVTAACAVPLVSLRVPEWAMDQAIDLETMRKIAHGEAE